jgi:uncharacterized membrane protein (UPF0127 family)
VLATECAVADTFVKRALGLIPRSELAVGEGLRLTRTSSITMFFMRFAIDVVFVERGGRVLKVSERLRPWSPAVWALQASDVLELPAGTVKATGTQVGDELVFESVV